MCFFWKDGMGSWLAQTGKNKEMALDKPKSCFTKMTLSQTTPKTKEVFKWKSIPGNEKDLTLVCYNHTLLFPQKSTHMTHFFSVTTEEVPWYSYTVAKRFEEKEYEGCACSQCLHRTSTLLLYLVCMHTQKQKHKNVRSHYILKFGKQEPFRGLAILPNNHAQFKSAGQMNKLLHKKKYSRYVKPKSKRHAGAVGVCFNARLS